MQIKAKARILAAVWLTATSVLASSMDSSRAADPARLSPAPNAQASELARASFDVFLTHAFRDTPTSVESAAIKVRRTGDRPAEWVRPYKIGDRLLGLVGDGAQLVPIDRAHIEDWSIIGPNGRLLGNFAARTVLDARPEVQVALATSLSEYPLPKQ